MTDSLSTDTVANEIDGVASELQASDPNASDRLAALASAIRDTKQRQWVDLDIDRIIDRAAIAERFAENEHEGKLYDIIAKSRDFLVFLPIGVTWLHIISSTSKYVELQNKNQLGGRAFVEFLVNEGIGLGGVAAIVVIMVALVLFAVGCNLYKDARVRDSVSASSKGLEDVFGRFAWLQAEARAKQPETLIDKFQAAFETAEGHIQGEVTSLKTIRSEIIPGIETATNGLKAEIISASMNFGKLNKALESAVQSISRSLAPMTTATEQIKEQSGAVSQQLADIAKTYGEIKAIVEPLAKSVQEAASATTTASQELTNAADQNLTALAAAMTFQSDALASAKSLESSLGDLKSVLGSADKIAETQSQLNEFFAKPESFGLRLTELITRFETLYQAGDEKLAQISNVSAEIQRLLQATNSHVDDLGKSVVALNGLPDSFADKVKSALDESMDPFDVLVKKVDQFAEIATAHFGKFPPPRDGEAIPDLDLETED